jgi:hypothetical protein
MGELKTQKSNPLHRRGLKAPAWAGVTNQKSKTVNGSQFTVNSVGKGELKTEN